MKERKKIILIFVFLLGAMLLLFWLQRLSQQKKELDIQKAKQVASRFIEEADSYTYQETDKDYISRLKPFITDSYLRILESKEILGIGPSEKEEKLTVTTKSKDIKIIAQEEKKLIIRVWALKTISSTNINREIEKIYKVYLLKINKEWKIDNYEIEK